MELHDEGLYCRSELEQTGRYSYEKRYLYTSKNIFIQKLRKKGEKRKRGRLSLLRLRVDKSSKNEKTDKGGLLERVFLLSIKSSLN